LFEYVNKLKDTTRKRQRNFSANVMAQGRKKINKTTKLKDFLFCQPAKNKKIANTQSISLSAHPCNRPFAAKHLLFLPMHPV